MSRFLAVLAFYYCLAALFVTGIGFAHALEHGDLAEQFLALFTAVALVWYARKFRQLLEQSYAELCVNAYRQGQRDGARQTARWM